MIQNYQKKNIKLLKMKQEKSNKKWKKRNKKMNNNYKSIKI